MILRPKTETELLALVHVVLSDATMQLDTRAFLALLLTSNLDRCPNKTALGDMLNADGKTKSAGFQRFNRMLREAEAAGYLMRSRKQVRNAGIFKGFAFVVGSQASITAANAEIHAHG